jgi:CHAT domain-containing protein/tetratricopeptide (TPR) repeat protein
MLATVLLALSPWATAKCPQRLSQISEALSLAQQLSSDEHSVATLACIDEALVAHLGTPAERAQLQLRTATWLETVGRYREARARLRAADEFLGAAGAEHERAAIEAELGWVDFRLGSLDSAEHALTLADASGPALSGLEHAMVLDHLGTVARERNDYAGAELRYSEALKLAQGESTASGGRVRAQIYNDRGGLRYYQSDFRSAVEDFRRALDLYRGLGMARTLEASKTHNNLGSSYQELGDTERARAELERALELDTALLGPRNPGTAVAISNLGHVAEQAHDYPGAAAYYARALAIFESTLGPMDAKVAHVAVHYGRLRRTTGDYTEARQLLERSRSIRDRTFGPYSNWSAETLVELVPVYTKLGQHDRARRDAERAVTAAVVSSEKELLYDCYMTYARQLASEGKLGAAIFFAKRAINVIQQMREQDVPPTKREQLSFLAQREYMYRDLADWLITTGRLPEAEQVLDLLKTEELADFAQLGPAAAEELTGRVGMVHREVPAAAALDEAIRDLSSRTDLAAHRPVPRDTWRARFIVRLEQLVATLNDKTPASARSTDDSGVPGLPAPRMAVVHYLVLAGQVRMLVRVSAGVVERSVAIDRTELNRKVLDLHHRLQSHVDSDAVARGLFKLLIEPFVSVLAAGGTQHLILVPDDVLRYVPFAALRDRERYLIESYTLSLATPAASYDALGKPRPLSSAVALGVSRTPDGQVLLPNVSAELHRVVRSSPGDGSGALPGVILLDRDFTRASAAQALAQRYPVVHIASHFVFRPGSLADSYLLLGDGTHLTLEAIKTNALPLRGVEMLTLSACETAIGETAADGREIESFAALAQHQGVRSVLATLWAVPDLSTSIIMARFYAHLAHSPDSFTARAEALRDAQLLLLRGPASSRADRPPAHSPYADPFYWASFTLLGSPT